MSLAAPESRFWPSDWRPLPLQSLVALRWLAVVGQTIGVLFVRFGLGFPLPMWECIGLIALSAILNLWLTYRYGNFARSIGAYAE